MESSLVVACMVAVCAVTSACDRSTSSGPRVVPSAEPVALPADHLATGELAEGTEKAFGFVLPRGFVISHRFDDVVISAGRNVSPEALANYVRRRVDAESTEVGPTRTVFVRAKLRAVAGAVTGGAAGGAAAGTSPILRIEAGEGPSGAELLVRDVTPAPVAPDLSESDRWKREGLTPQGKPLDPSRFF